MYKAFYGLSDNPFSIAPNPSYLFLSDRHREALAHLKYGLGETGGFVLLTGEVGTGKTTVSRCLLRQLPENTDTAFILNPSLTEAELLATLCDELGIHYGETPTLKQLTDLISRFLLNNHQAGRNTVMIIDEAQHLRPEVLEQLRLLTNLETDTKKLLQVILIGQPELQQLLKRQELRQLAQRITARYHLLPLTEQEVALYVQHRLQVAGRMEPLFNKGAIRALHRFSGGIPRIINLLCERALMAGYGQSKTPIDRKMVNAAAAEVLGELPQKRRWWLPLSAALVVVVAFGGGYYWLNYHQAMNQAQASENTVALTPAKPAAVQANKQADLTERVLNGAIDKSRDIDTAFAALFGLWNKAPYAGVSACQSASQLGMACFQQQGNLSSLQQLNYPAVVYLTDDAGKAFYGTLVASNAQQLLLQLGEQQFWVSMDWFNQHFSGMYELLWQPPEQAQQAITPVSSLEKVQWLENALATAAQRQPRVMSYFDTELEQELKAFQRQHGLAVDSNASLATLAQLSIYQHNLGPVLQSGGVR
ncbi:AAA family ATPase [Shewanella dokdonensis]|uniref:AAA family ATPase n=1 Tax=Shewanella dokdonensis TaxID=712036 RepID=A0ABX8DIJ0_9GAMM|nr:AAA family ATPase [Shewanella dokdonensis]MCL1073848.1 AAA family ATPase [Shewanella dokdonensis]QVK23632.1 AAA family ATPase [Shewanella dokdonensis]